MAINVRPVADGEAGRPGRREGGRERAWYILAASYQIMSVMDAI